MWKWELSDTDGNYVDLYTQVDSLEKYRPMTTRRKQQLLYVRKKQTCVDFARMEMIHSTSPIDERLKKTSKVFKQCFAMMVNRKCSLADMQDDGKSRLLM